MGSGPGGDGGSDAAGGDNDAVEAAATMGTAGGGNVGMSGVAGPTGAGMGEVANDSMHSGMDAASGFGPGLSVADVGFMASLSNSLGNVTNPTQGQVDQAIADAHGVADQATQAIAEGKDGQVVQAMVETQQDPTSNMAYAVNKGAIALGMHPVTAKASQGAVFGVGGLAARGMAEASGALSNMMTTPTGPSTGTPANGFNNTNAYSPTTGPAADINSAFDAAGNAVTAMQDQAAAGVTGPSIGGITDGIGGFSEVSEIR